MRIRSVIGFALVAAALSPSTIGCGGGGRRLPLETTNICPWVAPNRRAGLVYVHVRDNDWGSGGGQGYHVWTDQTKTEHKIDAVKERVWSYLEKTGVAAKIEAAETNGQLSRRVNIVSLNPIVAILVPCPAYPPINPYMRHHNSSEIGSGISVTYQDGMEWCSPDLKQRPTAISFSDEGMAEIVLPHDKLRLVRDGTRCTITRE